MSWAETFKINSDMSTPLNERINGLYKLQTSDNLYQQFSSETLTGSFSNGADKIYERSIKFLNAGSAKIRLYHGSFTGTSTSYSNPYYHYIIYKNSNEYLTGTMYDSSSIGYREVEIIFNTNDVIDVEFYMIPQSGAGYSDNCSLSIYGDVVQAAPLIFSEV